MSDIQFTVKSSSRKKKILISALILMWVVILGYGGLYLYNSNKTIEAPDPKLADIDTLEDFTKSEQFMEMSSKDRSKFVDAMVAKQLEKAQNDEAEVDGRTLLFDKMNMNGAMRGDKKALAFWKTWGKNRTNEICNMPPEQAEQVIDNYVNVLGVVAGKNTVKQMIKDADAMTYKAPVKQFLHSNIELSRGTTAKERAKMARVGAMVMWKMRKKYSRR